MTIKMTKKIIIIGLISFWLVSCFLFTGEDEELIMSRKINTSKKLRLDGYYLRSNCNSDETICVYDVFFLFENGILFTTGVAAMNKKELDKLKSILNKECFSANSKLKFNWGVYETRGDSVAYEKWYHRGKNYAYMKSGIILNDTTFRITKMNRSHKSDEKSLNKNEIYRFVKFNRKPDSTTVYID